WAELHHPEQLAAIQRDFPDDFQGAAYDPPPWERERGERQARGTYVDEWGCVWENLQDGVVGEVKDPLIKSYESDLGKLKPPTERIGKGFERTNESIAGADKFVLIGWANLFERMQFLRGSENLYMDLADLPLGFFKLRDAVHEFNMAMLEGWLKTNVDGLSFSDDWGAQRGLLISPAQWRELFKPCYRDYCNAIRAAGKFVFMHSDGHIFDIYEDLIEIGVDAINSQLFCMDIEEIGRRFKGRITFWGEIDRQRLLSFATVDDVRAGVRRVAEALYDGNGGAIAQCEFGAGAKPENVRAVYETWREIAG
ncbi:MAG: methyltransferase, partial [Phycisphaerae bacterium]|nr:methyltransferase [Phycisphaerae bacterium]